MNFVEAPLLHVALSGHGCLQSGLGSTTAGQNPRIAQELVDRDTRPKHGWTFDYLLKTSASQADRWLSIVELKRL